MIEDSCNEDSNSSDQEEADGEVSEDFLGNSVEIIEDSFAEKV